MTDDFGCSGVVAIIVLFLLIVFSVPVVFLALVKWVDIVGHYFGVVLP